MTDFAAGALDLVPGMTTRQFGAKTTKKRRIYSQICQQDFPCPPIVAPGRAVVDWCPKLGRRVGGVKDMATRAEKPSKRIKGVDK